MSTLRPYRLFFVLLALCFFSAGCSEKKPEDVVKAFFQAAAEGQHDKIMDLHDLSNFSPEDQKTVKEKSKLFFSKFKQDMDAQGGLKNLELLSVEQGNRDEYGDYVDVSMRISSNNGETREVSYPVYQRGKEYKLIIPKEILTWNP